MVVVVLSCLLLVCSSQTETGRKREVQLTQTAGLLPGSGNGREDGVARLGWGGGGGVGVKRWQCGGARGRQICWARRRDTGRKCISY